MVFHALEPRDPASPKLRMVLEPKYLSFCFGDDTPLAHHVTFGERGSLGRVFRVFSGGLGRGTVE